MFVWKVSCVEGSATWNTKIDLIGEKQSEYILPSKLLKCFVRQLCSVVTWLTGRPEFQHQERMGFH